MIRILILSTLAVLGLAAAGARQDFDEDLREAVRSGDVQRVKALLEAGADVNTQYENGFTPIYFADDPAVVDVLLAHGPELNIRDRASLQTPLENAADHWVWDERRRKEWETIVAKLRAAGAEYTIHAAVYMNDVGFVKDCLAEDASWVNKRRGAQSVPLRVAARTGRTEICKLLLEHQADPDDFEQGNGYPIMFDAVRHPAVVKLLIENKANLRRRFTWRGGGGVQVVRHEATALHYAVCAGSLESVRLLMVAGLDPNAADEQGQTPLHIAILCEAPHRDRDDNGSQFVKIIEYLLENDASVDFANSSGETPLDLVKTVDSPRDIQRLLRNKQAELDRRYQHAWSENEN